LIEVFQFIEPSAAPEAEGEPESAPRAEPTKAKPAPGTQAWYKSLPPPARNQGVDMNDLLRSIPKPRPPRKPK
jgi:hypothetical protein